MIDTTFIELIEKEIGYKPIFHDDYITKITFETSNVILKFQFLKENAKFFNKIEYDNDHFITIVLKDLFYIELEGEWYCNDTVTLMSKFIFTKIKDGYDIEFVPTCGLYGHFKAKDYVIIK